MSILQTLFGRKKNIEFDIAIKKEEDHPQYRLELRSAQVYLYPIYGAKEDICGKVNIHVPSGGRLDHTGISIELIGVVIDFTNGATVHEFLHERQDIEKPGVIMGKKSLKYSFKKVSKKYESYYGMNVRVRYYLRVVAEKAYGPNLAEEKDVWIIKKDKEPDSNKSIKMEVGVEDFLHIDFQCDKEKYHLTDVIVGSIQFVVTKLRIIHMDIEIIQKEIVGSGENAVTESETLAKFEIMDGTPVKDEVIPVRLYLQPYDLTPSYHNIQKLFSVKYYINIVLVDSEDRRLFKQQEILLWRKTDTI